VFGYGGMSEICGCDDCGNRKRSGRDGDKGDSR
jgi:hypothetical protein